MIRLKRLILFVPPKLRIIVFFILLTIIYTYPYVLHLGTLAHDRNDPLVSIWTMLWDRHILVSGPSAWPNLFDANIYHPYRYTLVFNEHLMGSMALALPLLWTLKTPLAALNALTLLTFVLAGSGMWLLTFHWTRDRRAALLAGVIFAFNPTRLLSMGQINILSVQWLPFSLLALFMFLRRQTGRHWLLLTVFINLHLLSAVNYSLHLAVTLAIFGLTWLLVRPVRLTPRLAIGLGALGLVTIGLNAPLWQGYIQASHLFGIERDLGAIRFYSASLADYLRVSDQSRMAGWWQIPVLDDSRLPAPLFPGLIPILMGLVGGLFITFRRPRSAPIYASWALLLIGLVFSFGANELALGRSLEPIVARLLPYPWLWESLPSIRGFRVPARFAILVYLALSLFSGATYAALRKILTVRRPWLDAGLGVALAAVLSFEYFVPPVEADYFPFAPNISPAYDWLRGVPPTAVVQEFPFYSGVRGRSYEPARMYYSALHWRRLVNGSSGYNPRPVSKIGSLMASFPNWRTIETMQRLGVNYAVLHPREYGTDPSVQQWGDVWRNLRSYLFALDHVSQVGEDFVLELAQPGCPLRPSELSTQVFLESDRSQGLVMHILFKNTSASAFVADPNRPSDLVVRWLQDDRVLSETYSNFQEPLLVLPAETEEILLPLELPEWSGEQNANAVEVIAQLASLNRAISERFEIAVEGHKIELISDYLHPQSRQAGVSEMDSIENVPADARLPTPVRFDGGALLLGYQVPEDKAAPCLSLPVTLYWQTPPEDEKPKQVTLSLLNHFGQVEIEDVTHPWSGAAPGRLVADGHVLPLPGPLPAGRYTLSVRLQESDDTLLPAYTSESPVESLPLADVVVRPLRPEMVRGEWQPVSATVADAVALVAYRLDHTQISPGDWLRLTLVWQARTAPGQDATVFTQLMGPDGQVWAQYDNPPRGGSYPTSLWQPGELVSDDYLFQVKPDTPPGRYTLITGMYLPDTLERLPVQMEGGFSGDTILLAEIDIVIPDRGYGGDIPAME